MSRFLSTENHLSYKEAETSQTECKKTPILVNTKTTEILELPHKDFKAAIMKMLQ